LSGDGNHGGAPRRRRAAVAIPAIAALLAGAVALAYFTWERDAGADAGEPAWATTQPAGGDAAATIAAIRRHLERRPGDLRAWLIMARIQFAGGAYAESTSSFEQALRENGALARQAGVWAEYAEALAMQAGGRLQGAPARAIDHALALNPKERKALELAGGAALEAGDPALALERWSLLLEQLPPGSREHAQLLAAIERVEMRTGTMR
jgi:cytochrome c-type biogenesis protein CcmH